MYEYEIVPVLVTRGAGGATAKDEWRELQETLNRYGRLGFRVVAVTEGQEGRAVIMERRQDPDTPPFESSVAQAAADITLESSRDAR
jgi:uncharacterized protein DUF4177